MGGLLAEACQDATHRVPRNCQVLPFLIFGGSVQQFTPAVADLPRFVFPKMTQFLGANQKRVGLYLRAVASGIAIATIGNGQGVQLTQCMAIHPAFGQPPIEIFLTAEDPDAFIVDPWFVASTAALIANDIVLTGAEVVQVG